MTQTAFEGVSEETDRMDVCTANKLIQGGRVAGQRGAREQGTKLFGWLG
jgi:hypothetical protein